MNIDPHPFTALSPDLVLAAMDSAGYVTDARILPLNSYENRVYLIGLEEHRPVVAKFYRPGRWSDEQILEEHAFAAELMALDISVAAPIPGKDGHTLHRFREFRYAVFPCLPGRQPDLDSDDVLRVLGRYLGRVHLAGAAGKFRRRIILGVEDMADKSREYLLENEFIPAELIPAYEAVSRQLIASMSGVWRHVNPRQFQRIHGDCHPGNVLWQEGVPHFVDFDDTVSGPAIQDVWMLLSGDRNQRQAQLQPLAEGYNEFYRFPAGQLPLIETLRTMRLMHYSAWLARRWQDPAFSRNFPWFNTTRYWSQHVLELREQQAALEEEPLELR